MTTEEKVARVREYIRLCEVAATAFSKNLYYGYAAGMIQAWGSDYSLGYDNRTMLDRELQVANLIKPKEEI